jgi:hypothetical protein
VGTWWPACGGWIIERPCPKTGEPLTFIDFARSEGRFAKHFDRNGNLSPELQAGCQERLDNWHTLQELARSRKPAPKEHVRPQEGPAHA